MNVTSAGRFVFLDYMRVLAFVSVLIGHKFSAELLAAISDPGVHITLRYFLQAIWPLCIGGAAGVVVFFLTSGYIITHVLQKEAPVDFVVKRIFRIYPLFIVAVLLEAAMGYWVYGLKLPPASVMIPRLLLIGDFFDVPNALAGVEWTLRIEVLFYACMVVFKAVGLFTFQRCLPLVYLGVGVVLYVSPPFPISGNWNSGYINTYSLFLFVGSLIYLAQQSLADRRLSALCGGGLVLMFLIKISAVQPSWKESNYAIISVGIFLLSVFVNKKLVSGRALTLISDLTFSVYLFHNWLWGYLEIPVGRFGLVGLSNKFVIAILLLSICYLFHRTVERLGQYAGKAVLRKLPSVSVTSIALHQR